MQHPLLLLLLLLFFLEAFEQLLFGDDLSLELVQAHRLLQLLQVVLAAAHLRVEVDQGELQVLFINQGSFYDSFMVLFLPARLW